MRPKTYTEDRVSTAYRLPADLHQAIKAEAEARYVSVNWLVTRLLAEGMESLRPIEEQRLTRRPGDGA